MTRSASDMNRREALAAAGGVVLGSMLASGLSRADDRCVGADSAEASAASDRGPNVLFILVDQERYLSELPPGLSFPARERLQQMGVTFINHQIASAVCTSSRSVIYTGQHIQHTKLFDNMDVPWTTSLSRDMPTLGDMMTDAGYYAAYKGKWHLSREFGTHDELALPTETNTNHMKEYGFQDYVGIGDVIGMTHGGYLNDSMIAEQGVRWLRVRGKEMQRQGKSWFLALNFVNPHDVMFYNTDAVGTNIQDNGKLLMDIARDPDVAIYRQQWEAILPESRRQRFDAEGRPQAHREYQRARGFLVGDFPNEDARWARLLNYYYNCMRDVDQKIQRVLDELDDLGLTENTVIVMTADHGELGGAHGTHGKGSTAYQEQNHVPLIIAHPAHRAHGGQVCRAVTSHVDIAPTLVNWTGADAQTQSTITRNLNGKDLTPLLTDPSSAGFDAVREGSLYCFGMLMYLDSDFIQKVSEYLAAGNDPNGLKDAGYKPDFMKRGMIRSVFDGRYKYSRYFAPKQHNTPQTLEEVLRFNDVELFDLENDPFELVNLAMDTRRHGDLLLQMNEKMNRLVAQEVGDDNGDYLPGSDDVSWAVTRFDP